MSGPKPDSRPDGGDDELVESTVDSAEGADAARLPAEAGAATDDEERDEDRVDAPAATAGGVDVDEPTDAREPWLQRNLQRLIALGAVLVIWTFVGWHERFRVTPASVFLCLGALAVVEAVLFLWRTGFSASDEDPGDAAWWKPSGETDELLREKRSLLKAIKEIEFDHDMGKLTDDDAGEIVGMYRARAIEVIKAIDAIEASRAGAGAGTVRDEIERELKARLEVRGKSRNKKRDKAKKERA